MRKTSATLLALLSLTALSITLSAQEPTAVYVELKSPAPTAVARWQAQRAGKPFNADLHRASIRLAQDQLLSQLTAAGVDYSLTSVTLAGGLSVPNRYTELINAVRLAVTPEHVSKVRANSNVKHISVDTPRRLVLNNSTDYIRATGPDSARSRGLRGQGQVIAVLDTGIDHTHPMFDAQVDDSRFTARSGDLRPVRLQGTPYVEGVNHPKVVYRFLFSTAPAEGDDTGHGTSVASAAAGLKAQAGATLHNGEIVEGVAPGALLMDYKVCPSLACTNEQILMALEDVARETDLAGNPKPVATVVNMSFGDTAGDPYSADAIAAGNLQFLGIMPEASAGNGCDLVEDLVFGVCLTENIIGSPAAGRLVLATAATTDPGSAPGSADVLDSASIDRNSTGGITPATQLALAGGQRSTMNIFPMAGTPSVPSDAVAQYYVYVNGAELLANWPTSARGRIALAQTSLPSLFAQTANNAAAAGAVAVLLLSSTTNATAVAGPIPAYTIGLEDGEYLKDILSSSDDDTVNPPNGALSEFPIRLNASDPRLIDTAGFSSRGPNNDFLVVKPDVTAPGVQILMAASKVGALGDPSGYTSADGTSFSGPQVAGGAALVRGADGGRPDFTPSMVRAALMNGSTNIRMADGSEIADSDDRNFIHATGAGLVDMVRATDITAVMGSNELNGAGGPDDHRAPDFLPSHSFGELRLIGTELPAGDLRQQRSVTVTVADVRGSGGSYSLSLLDGGARRGDITRPLTESGFSLNLSQSSVSVPAGGRATFRVNLAVDGTAGGLQIAGADQLGFEATEFLWWVVARSSSDETLRMPMYARISGGVPGGGAVASAGGHGWISTGGGKAQFKFAADQASGGTLRYQDSGVRLDGTVTALTASGPNAAFSGPCTLDGAPCGFTAQVQDNADPGKGADRFTLEVTTSSGSSFSADGLLGAGNITVRTQ